MLTLVIGIALVGAYLVLKALDVVGQPTDIGGGSILVAGYVVTAVGAVLVGRGLLRYRCPVVGGRPEVAPSGQLSNRQAGGAARAEGNGPSGVGTRSGHRTDRGRTVDVTRCVRP